MADLLVSVRSAAEAVEALAGGAAVIDVKDPDRGPLGCAEGRVWREVRGVLPAGVPLSVALGELSEWSDPERCRRLTVAGAFAGVAYRKLGLSAAGVRWRRDWAGVRRRLGAGPAWIAVAYADWAEARAPHPDEVRDAALEDDGCAGILVDTFDKSKPSPLAADPFWSRWFARARGGRPLSIALAGGLDAAAIARLAPLGPDLFAVRGAACDRGDRRGTIVREKVAELARATALSRPAGTGRRR